MMKHRLTGCGISFKTFRTLAVGWINFRSQKFKGDIHPGKCVLLALNRDNLKLDEGGLCIHDLLNDLSRADLVVEDIVDHTHIIVDETALSARGKQER